MIQATEVDFTEDLFFESDESDEDSLISGEFSLSSTSSDEETLQLNLIEKIFSREKRHSVKGYFEEIMSEYSAEEFIRHFRVNVSVYKLISARFENSEIFKKLEKTHRAKSAAFHVALFLWYAGHECTGFHDIADRFDVSISTVHAILKRVAYFISGLSGEYITWPNDLQKVETSNHFFREKGFPGIIGCIDGTHVVIDPPKHGKDEYIDRKGDISLHMQGICDENSRFIDIFVGYPGSVHDARVLQNSEIYHKLPYLCGDKYLLGDSAYACTNFMLTPYRDNGHLTTAQKKFNMKLSSCRVKIEHSFGKLKQRFRQLYFCKLQGIEYLCHFIRACCVLHNMSDIEESELFIEPIHFEENYSQNEDIGRVMDTAAGKALRDDICNRLFQR